MTGLWLDGVPRPDHGPGMTQRACRCGAGWVGLPDDPCGWCADALERQVADERRMLLDPPSLHSDNGHPRYDELDELDRAVWDRTRGQTRGTESVKTWLERLARAVRAGLITRAEACAAVDRLEKR
jgi:hypothetical protein